ncbi:hypothetical protein M1M07_07365 [Rhodococcus sp. HM1]|uniref:hypothetical protein n=1 Tax=Rhodococcus sp. HM1 TaxID=2937759 RepID=UPI00200AA031|nr:hypothetical protein [Rhodococcus sp. HM1]MCK8670934.1 hypothetical protein [Rhodococcus sp. HM1]
MRERGGVIIESLIFGVIASSALVIGALVGGRFTIPKRALAAMLAFAAGALITALTFELFEESYQKGGIWRAALGLAVGAIVFTLLSQQLDRLAEGRHRQPHGSEKLDLDAATEKAPSTASVSGAAPKHWSGARPCARRADPRPSSSARG